MNLNFIDLLIVGLIIVLTILIFLFDKEKDIKSKLINFFSKLSLSYFAIAIIVLLLSEYIFISARPFLIMLGLHIISAVVSFILLIVFHKDLHLYSIYDSPFRNKAQFDRFLTNKLFKHDFNLLPDTDDFLIYKKLTRDYYEIIVNVYVEHLDYKKYSELTEKFNAYYMENLRLGHFKSKTKMILITVIIGTNELQDIQRITFNFLDGLFSGVYLPVVIDYKNNKLYIADGKKSRSIPLHESAAQSILNLIYSDFVKEEKVKK